MGLPQKALFNTVPEDVCNFFNKGSKVDGKKVIDFFQYSKKDVAAAANIPLASIRYDENKMPAELKERLTEWATAINLVASFFQDPAKTMLWFSISNPLLGDMSPRDMIRVGRYKKLLNFIQTALNENQKDSVSGKTKKE